ncbi:MAG TPA: SPOR domain-containing protein [Aestuariivirga sp.]|nr:SPOR domain-containing protein [Aestuariivirga sp.]
MAASGPAFATSEKPNEIIAEQAYEALAAGDQKTAISAYSQAIESQDLPTEVLANALLNRGLAYQQLAEHREAIDDYTAALQLDAMSAEMRATALYNRGLSQQKLPNLSAAVEDYTSALFLDPTFAHAYYGRGNALRESGQFLFALSDYEKATRYHHPNAAQVYYAEALTYESLKRPNEARKSLEQAVAANPRFKQAVDRLASLQGSVMAKPSVVASVGGGQLTVRKPDLPKAVEPSAALLNGGESDPIMTSAVNTPEPVSKKIIDRVPVEEEKIVAVEVVEDDDVTASGEPEAAEPTLAEIAESSADEEAEVEPAAAPAMEGWSVQVASATSEDGAWSTWKKMKAKHQLLGAEKPIVVKADLGTKGIVYRVRLAGFEDQNAAKKSCTKLKSSGVSCYVSKLNS